MPQESFRPVSYDAIGRIKRGTVESRLFERFGTPEEGRFAEFQSEGHTIKELSDSLGLNERSVWDALRRNNYIQTAGRKLQIAEEHRYLIDISMKLNILSILTEKELQTVAFHHLLEPPMTLKQIAGEQHITQRSVWRNEERAFKKLRKRKEEVPPLPIRITKKMVEIEQREGRSIEELVFFEERSGKPQEERAARFEISRHSYNLWRRMLGYEPEKAGRKPKVKQ